MKKPENTLGQLLGEKRLPSAYKKVVRSLHLSSAPADAEGLMRAAKAHVVSLCLDYLTSLKGRMEGRVYKKHAILTQREIEVRLSSFQVIFVPTSKLYVAIAARKSFEYSLKQRQFFLAKKGWYASNTYQCGIAFGAYNKQALSEEANRTSRLFGVRMWNLILATPRLLTKAHTMRTVNVKTSKGYVKYTFGKEKIEHLVKANNSQKYWSVSVATAASRKEARRARKRGTSMNASLLEFEKLDVSTSKTSVATKTYAKVEQAARAESKVVGKQKANAKAQMTAQGIVAKSRADAAADKARIEAIRQSGKFTTAMKVVAAHNARHKSDLNGMNGEHTGTDGHELVMLVMPSGKQRLVPRKKALLAARTAAILNCGAPREPRLTSLASSHGEVTEGDDYRATYVRVPRRDRWQSVLGDFLDTVQNAFLILLKSIVMGLLKIDVQLRYGPRWSQLASSHGEVTEGDDVRSAHLKPELNDSDVAVSGYYTAVNSSLTAVSRRSAKQALVAELRSTNPRQSRLSSSHGELTEGDDVKTPTAGRSGDSQSKPKSKNCNLSLKLARLPRNTQVTILTQKAEVWAKVLKRGEKLRMGDVPEYWQEEVAFRAGQILNNAPESAYRNFSFCDQNPRKPPIMLAPKTGIEMPAATASVVEADKAAKSEESEDAASITLSHASTDKIAPALAATEEIVAEAAAIGSTSVEAPKVVETESEKLTTPTGQATPFLAFNILNAEQIRREHELLSMTRILKMPFTGLIPVATSAFDRVIEAVSDSSYLDAAYCVPTPITADVASSGVVSGKTATAASTSSTVDTPFGITAMNIPFHRKSISNWWQHTEQWKLYNANAKMFQGQQEMLESWVDDLLKSAKSGAPAPPSSTTSTSTSSSAGNVPPPSATSTARAPAPPSSTTGTSESSSAWKGAPASAASSAVGSAASATAPSPVVVEDECISKLPPNLKAGTLRTDEYFILQRRIQGELKCVALESVTADVKWQLKKIYDHGAIALVTFTAAEMNVAMRVAAKADRVSALERKLDEAEATRSRTSGFARLKSAFRVWNSSRTLKTVAGTPVSRDWVLDTTHVGMADCEYVFTLVQGKGIGSTETKDVRPAQNRSTKMIVNRKDTVLTTTQWRFTPSHPVFTVVSEGKSTFHADVMHTAWKEFEDLSTTVNSSVSTYNRIIVGANAHVPVSFVPLRDYYTARWYTSRCARIASMPLFNLRLGN